jgi:hypothetical protein
VVDGLPPEHGRHCGPKSDAVLDRGEFDAVLEVTAALGISLGQWDRLPPRERDLRLSKHRRDKMRCPDCGNPVEVCSDPVRLWYSYRRICFASMEREAAEAALSAIRGETAKFHDGSFMKWSSKRSEGFPYPAGAGETIGVAEQNLAPHDRFTTELAATPIPSSPRVAENVGLVEQGEQHGGDDRQTDHDA